MLEGLIWMFSGVACGLLVIHQIPKAVQSTVEVYRKRIVEAPTKEPPSAVCPVDAGDWNPWSEIREERRPNNPAYPTTGGLHVVRSQTRTCKSCGFGERRVLG